MGIANFSIGLVVFITVATPCDGHRIGPCDATQSSTEDPVEMREPTPPLMEADKPRPSDYPPISGEITVSKALRSIYGNYDTETNTAGWLADLPEMRYIMHKTEGGQRKLRSGPTVFPVVLVAEQHVLGPARERYLLLTAPTWPYGYGCHSCQPPVGGAIFERTSRGWHLLWSRKAIDYIGLDGGPPRDTEPVRIGPDRMGFVLHPSYSSGGITESGRVLIGEVQNELKEILDLEPTSSDNDGDCVPRDHDCWRYDTTLTFTPGDNPEYFDIIRVTTGTHGPLKGDPIIEVKASARYVFREGRYWAAP